jgi:hypothetical protein
MDVRRKDYFKMPVRKNMKRPVHGGAKLVFDNQKELFIDSKCFGELLDFWKGYKKKDHSRVVPIKSESYPLTCGLCMRTILPDRREGQERRVFQYGLVIHDRRLRNRRNAEVGHLEHAF